MNMIKRISLETIKDSDDLIYTRELWSDGSVCWYNRIQWKQPQEASLILEDKYQKDIMLNNN